MLKLDHVEISVDDYRSSRDFYVQQLGFKVEFEVPERRIAAVRDEYDFTLFLAEHMTAGMPRSCVLTLQVDDVDETYRALSARGLSFEQPPSRLFWGYGAELRDPNDYLLRLWDAGSMRTKASP
jgi:catechol 2,3-dioxygenase-like lactoylglutathione lyase family enzyme